MNPNNKIFSEKEIFELVNQTFEMIVNKNKYHIKSNQKPLDLDTIKSLYNGFYAGFILLMKNPNLDNNKKINIIDKKIIIDELYSKDIKYEEYNDLKYHKNYANYKNNKKIKKIIENSKLSNFS